MRSTPIKGAVTYAGGAKSARSTTNMAQMENVLAYTHTVSSVQKVLTSGQTQNNHSGQPSGSLE